MKKTCLFTTILTVLTVGSGSELKAQTVEALAQQNGCLKCHNADKPLVGPAFRDVAAKARVDARNFDLTLMSVTTARDLPERRRATVVVAQVGREMHVRIFDIDGMRLVDKRVADEAAAQLKARIGAATTDGKVPSPDDRREIITRTLALPGLAPTSARQALIETVKKGGKGKWPHAAKGAQMPAFANRLSNADIGRLVDWVLLRGVQPELKVMKTGLGSGKVKSNPDGIDCGNDCVEVYANATAVTLTATPDAGSVFARWEGDVTGSTNPISVNVDSARSVRAVFDLAPALPKITDFRPEGIRAYLTANPQVNSAARFLNALPNDFKENWLLMTRSESLQTGTAASPRLILPSADAQFVFTIGMLTHDAFPASHPSAIEYMQWDGTQKNFRFHEIVLDNIPQMDVHPARTRGISIDEVKCSKCHSTRNVVNTSMFPGTSPGQVKVKNKPNWDTYDSWAGLLPFNRDRIYQGSLDAAAFRKFFNPWTWQTNDAVRSIVEQLKLQPDDNRNGSVPQKDVIKMQQGGPYDGHLSFDFDDAFPVLTEPAPTGSDFPTVNSNYEFNGVPGTGAATLVERHGKFVTLHHSGNPGFEEGRAVQLFDLLGGADGNFNQLRIADELANHRPATGNGPTDVRPIALAIARRLIGVSTSNTITGVPSSVDLTFFENRHGMNFGNLLVDTRKRAESVPRRKADLQKYNLDRTADVYLNDSSTNLTKGLIPQFGAATAQGATDTSLGRLRQEVLRRPIDDGTEDKVTKHYVDREHYFTGARNTERVALFRFFLEPLGVSVDKWSMGVRGRSRAYAFADVFEGYLTTIRDELEASLRQDPIPGLTDPTDDAQLLTAVQTTLGTLPSAGAIPSFIEIQRIFNKSCIECHGGLNYPPYRNFGTLVDFSENEAPGPGETRLSRSYNRAIAYTNGTLTSRLYRLITKPSEACTPTDVQLMPCAGPALSACDVETIKRWILGGNPSTGGDPHIRTVDGVNYDFHGAGEFILLRSEGLEVQVRQVAVSMQGPLRVDPHTGLASGVSINGAVAIRAGKHVIVYQPKLKDAPDATGLELWINKKSTALPAEGISLTGGVRVAPTTAPGGIQVEAGGGTVIVVTPGFWEHFQLWYLNIDTRHVRATEGLMGIVAPGNWLPAVPNGKLLGPKPESTAERYKMLYEQFGKAWRVTEADSLFVYAPGASPKTFAVEAWPGLTEAKAPAVRNGPANKEALKPIALEQAQQISKHIVDEDRRRKAIQDVMTSGEPGFARTYLAADEILRRKPPAEPQLLAPADALTPIDPATALTWRKSVAAKDAPLTYRLYVWPTERDVEESDAVRISDAEARGEAGTIAKSIPKLEAGKSYYWKVVVQDDKGGRTESETHRFVVRK